MSLLMEALRKAEEEKEQQPEPESMQPETDDATGEEDSLLVLDLPDPADTAPAPVILEAPPGQEGETAKESEESEAAFQETLPRGEGRKASVSRPGPPPPLEAELEEEAEPPAKVETEQEMARALFQARARTRKRRLWLGLLVVLAMICLAALVGWYLMVVKMEQGVSLVTAVPPAASHDTKGTGVASEPLGEVDGATEPTGVDEGGASSDIQQGPHEESVAQQDVKPVDGGETRPAQRQQTEPPEKKSVPAGNPVEKPATSVSSQPQARPAAAPMTAEAAYHQAMDRMAGGETRNPAIQIRRSTRKTGKANPVRKAWQAFQARRYPEADRLYAAVLVKEPYNRDALLGRAAVAVATGKPRAAQDFYLRLLERDPRDPLAQAGMISLQGLRQPVEAIARVQQLIAANPDLGGLNFILGNLYAAQKRWSYAQQAYFKAHASDPENPDYLFNLAVSLDHLGKERQALEFYRRALQQAQQHEARFPAETVSRRILALSAGENRQP